MRRFIICLLIIVFIDALSGCSSTRTCPEPAETDVGPAKWFAPSLTPLKTHTGGLWSESLLKAVHKAGRKPLNVLVLSGGGPNGAFGGGFLIGLAERNGDVDLGFDIVTAISTGALQATWAFLGEQHYEPLRMYIEVTEKDILTKRGVLEFLWASSLYDNTPLRELLKGYITDNVIKEVADAHEDGRRLYVGTVNLDTGEFVLWDMGEIALGRNEEAIAQYIDILMAASATPVVFPPVLLREGTSEGLHTDGGAREVLFLRNFMVDLSKAVERERQISGDEETAKLDKATVSVIVNDKIGLGYVCTRDYFVDVGLRSLSALMDQSKIDGLFRAYAVARSNNTNFRMIRIPDHVPTVPSENIDSVIMQAQFEAGFDMATEETIPWETKPPTAEDLD